MDTFVLCNDTATTEIYTLSLHDALPISGDRTRRPLRHLDVRGARASAGTARGSPSRHMVDRDTALRDARGHVAVPRQDGAGRALRRRLSPAETDRRDTRRRLSVDAAPPGDSRQGAC